MSNRTKFILLTSIGTIIVIVILFVIYFIYKQNFPVKEGTTVTTPYSITKPKTEEQTFSPSKISPLTEQAKEKSELEKMVFNFAESLGSYSNQSDFQNILSLKNLATSKMQNWIDDFINQEKNKNKLVNNYFGITTKALNIKEVKFNVKKTEAEFLINVQRQEAKDSTQNTKVYFQDVLVKLIKEKDDWKIDELQWNINQ